MNDLDLRRTDEGVEVFDALSGEWVLLSSLDMLPEDIEFIESQDVEGKNLATDFGFGEESAQPATTGGGQFFGPQNAGLSSPEGFGANEPVPTKPSWWDDLRQVTGGNVPAWEEVGFVEEEKPGSRGTETHRVFRLSALDEQLNYAEQAATRLGLIEDVPEEQPQTPDIDFSQMPDRPFGWTAGPWPPEPEPGQTANDYWNNIRQHVDNSRQRLLHQDIWADTEEAHQVAKLRGLSPDQYHLQTSGGGVAIVVDEAKGQIYDDYETAQENLPPDHEVVQRQSDGRWQFRRKPKRQFSSWDQLIRHKFLTEGTSAARRVADFQFSLENRISIQDAIGIALQVATTPTEFMDLMRLAQQEAPIDQADAFTEAAIEAQQAIDPFSEAPGDEPLALRDVEDPFTSEREAGTGRVSRPEVEGQDPFVQEREAGTGRLSTPDGEIEAGTGRRARPEQREQPRREPEEEPDPFDPEDDPFLDEVARLQSRRVTRRRASRRPSVTGRSTVPARPRRGV